MSSSEQAPDPSPAPTSAPRPDRALLVVLALILVFVAVALVVVFTRGQPATLAADTPDGVVQRYASAALAGDDDAAAAYLSTRARSADAQPGCGPGAASETENLRVTLLDVQERERTAEVRVSLVTSYDSGPFGSPEYETDDVFTLVKADGDWLIDQAPWQLTVCPSPAEGNNP